MTKISDADRDRLRHPVTWQDFEFRARHALQWVASPFGDDEKYLRMARRDLEAARILKGLEDLHS